MSFLRSTVFLGIFGAFGCGGVAEPAHSQADDEADRPIASAAPKPSTTATAPSPSAEAERTARAFFDAIATHDVDAAVRVSSDEAFARDQARRYANVTTVHFDGPGKADEWPGQEDSFLFWATVTKDGKQDRLLLAVAREQRGWKASAVRDETLRAQIPIDRTPAPPPAPPPPSEVRGKLLTKPIAGAVKVQLDGPTPAVGDTVELSRRIDASVPLFGGGWVVIADTVVAAVSGKEVTLKIVAQKSEMKINGKPLDHYTVGVPINVKWTKAP